MTCARAQAPTSSAQTKPITLEEAVTQALQHNLEVQIQRVNPEVSRFTLKASYSAYDPVSFASAQHQYSLAPGGIDNQSRAFQGSEIETDSFSTGFRGLLPFGLTYSLSGNVSDSYGNRPSFRTDPTKVTGINLVPFVDALGNPAVPALYTLQYDTIPTRDPFENSSGSIGFLELRQPLLKNFWIDGTRANILVSKNRLKFSEQGLRLQIMSIVTRVEQAYYELIFAREDVKVQEKAFELAERLLAENRKRVEVGAMAPLDEKQAESQVAASKAALLITQRVLSERENALKNLLTDDYAQWHDISLLPAENLMAVPAIFDLQESWKKGLTLRPDLLQTRLDLDRTDINLRLDRNQLFPQLDVIGRYGFAGQGDEFSRTFGKINEGSNPFYLYGAELSFPLGNRAARQSYNISKAQKEQAKLLLKKKEQDIMVEIDNAVKVAQTNLERVEATRQARLYAEAALDAEQKKLENGKSTSFFVLQLQRDLTARRSDEIRSLADYNNALAQLALVEGSVLERNRLSLDFK